MPVALISTRTSPAFGPSRSSSMISSGFFASNATAARVFILSSTFALQDVSLQFSEHEKNCRSPLCSFRSHASIFGFLYGGWLVLMPCGPSAANRVAGAGSQIDIDVVQIADDVLVITKRRHHILLRRTDILAAGCDNSEEVCIAHGIQ